ATAKRCCAYIAPRLRSTTATSTKRLRRSNVTALSICGQQHVRVEDPARVERALDRTERIELFRRTSEVYPRSLGGTDAVLRADAPVQLDDEAQHRVGHSIIVGVDARHV